MERAKASLQRFPMGVANRGTSGGKGGRFVIESTKPEAEKRGQRSRKNATVNLFRARVMGWVRGAQTKLQMALNIMIKKELDRV